MMLDDESAGPPAEGPADIELSAMRLLARREHSRRELQRKLVERHSRSDLVTDVLDDLEQRGLLSDRRFAESYFSSRVRRGFGPLRVRNELAERGVDAELVMETLSVSDDEWTSLLMKVAERKFGSSLAEDAQTLAKRGRFLQQRGFPTDLIRRYLDQVRGY